jgi:L-arabinokinase
LQTRAATVAFYVSGHGFGHASRVIEVMNALAERHPQFRLVVRTSAPHRLFELTVRSATFDAATDVYAGETDTGIVQIDSLRLDARGSVERARAFMDTFESRVAEELRFLEREQVSLVVADIPPLGLAAAARAGLPAVGLGNFTWDWIYSRYPDTSDLVRTMGDAYAHADVALRLPMHGGFATFRRIVDLPFVARRSARTREETRRALGLPLDDRLVLTSFGGYGLDGLDLDELARLTGYRVIVSGVPLGDAAGAPIARAALLPLNEGAMYAAGLRYEDLVRAVDVVVTKPGYGIIAECVANGTALLYTSRGDFIEYDTLVEYMPRVLRTRFIDHADLFSGKWRRHLDALLAQPPPPEHPAIDGAQAAAEFLRGLIPGC